MTKVTERNSWRKKEVVSNVKCYQTLRLSHTGNWDVSTAVASTVVCRSWRKQEEEESYKG